MTQRGGNTPTAVNLSHLHHENSIEQRIDSEYIYTTPHIGIHMLNRPHLHPTNTYKHINPRIPIL